jgi:hypothetical protein
MLITSISLGEASPMPMIAQARIASANFSRASGVKSLVSASPLGRPLLGKITTAAATTGPAQGPRPASSIP